MSTSYWLSTVVCTEDIAVEENTHTNSQTHATYVLMGERKIGQINR